MLRATVTSKGQVTIPKQVRDALGLERSTVIVFEVKRGEVTIRAAGEGLKSRFASIRPSASPEDWDAIRAKTREQVAREAADELR